MTQQYSLDFTQTVSPAAQERIRAGMKQADDNAEIRWRHVFDACVLAAARKYHEVTVDLVLDEIDALPDPPSTHNLSAIGPAMKRASDMGIIVPTDRVKRSARPQKRGNYHKVWISKYYTGESK